MGAAAAESVRRLRRHLAARRADVHLTWGEVPEKVGARIERLRELAAAEGRADVSTLDSFAEDGHGGTDITTTQTMRAAGLPTLTNRVTQAGAAS